MSLFGEYLEEEYNDNDNDGMIGLSEAEYNAIMEARALLEFKEDMKAQQAAEDTIRRTSGQIGKIAKKLGKKSDAITAADMQKLTGAEKDIVKSYLDAKKVLHTINNSGVKDITGYTQRKTASHRYTKNRDISGYDDLTNSKHLATTDKNKLDKLKAMAGDLKSNSDVKKILALAAAGVITAGAATIAIKKIRAAKAKKAKKKATNESIEMIYINDEGFEESVDLSFDEYAAIMEFKSEDDDPFVMNEAEYTAYNNYKADQLLESLDELN